MFAFTQLRCFVAVAEELHFHRAAARLNMTQPPLSRQIQLLEHALGVTLLLRGNRAVALTPAGAAFLHDARRMLQLAERATLHARRIAGGQSGQLTIGFTAASGYGVLPRLVGLLRSRLPEVQLALREMVSLDQIEALQAGRIDLALLRPMARRPGLRTARLLREPLLLALPRAHPLATRPEAGLAELAEQPLVTYPPVEGRYLHDLVMGLFQVAGAVPERVQYVSQTHSILALVGAGLGIALVPQAAARLCPEDVLLRPPPGGIPVAAELALAWREEGENPAAPAVLAALRQDWAGLCAGWPGAGAAPEETRLGE
ncbi:LysR substrate-binding domain-containing protein [Roseomonas haemaphysalidis]|uniref:LysR family transcriptional regulator n=1 Tax=Roseomonas haemaphysalidis TaxID=2768162 RepID=A0ABS3KT97_9PROT|nr:LysR substrate-binding domain-containing protein [Roseomonas haemaphysalidis]MBO1080692.1 LysR family transcriptional regulator [Roseomonas haemaphysalidis]